jgi:hypothetical protein
MRKECEGNTGEIAIYRVIELNAFKKWYRLGNRKEN